MEPLGQGSVIFLLSHWRMIDGRSKLPQWIPAGFWVSIQIQLSKRILINFFIDFLRTVHTWTPPSPQFLLHLLQLDVLHFASHFAK